MVMVVSTTGDGEPPDTAAKFWRRLKKKTLPSDHLAKLNYALLGNCLFTDCFKYLFQICMNCLVIGLLHSHQGHSDHPSVASFLEICGGQTNQ